MTSTFQINFVEKWHFGTKKQKFKVAKLTNHKNYSVNESLRDQISKSDNNYIRFHVTFRLEIILCFYYDGETFTQW